MQRAAHTPPAGGRLCPGRRCPGQQGAPLCCWMLMLMLRMPGLFPQPWPERRAPAPAPPPQPRACLRPSPCRPPSCARSWRSCPWRRAAWQAWCWPGWDRLVLAWRLLAAVAFDSESGCLLLDFGSLSEGAVQGVVQHWHRAASSCTRTCCAHRGTAAPPPWSATLPVRLRLPAGCVLWRSQQGRLRGWWRRRWRAWA
jgi:hypothetical protein